MCSNRASSILLSKYSHLAVLWYRPNKLRTHEVLLKQAWLDKWPKCLVQFYAICNFCTLCVQSSWFWTSWGAALSSPSVKLRESRARHGLGGGKVSSATGLTVNGRKEDLVQSDLFDSMFISYIWGETRYCGVGGNNRSSIMECITKNETYVREARFVLLCSSSLNLPKCADVQDSSGTSLSNFGEWVWSVLWLMGSIVLTVWREVGSRI